MSEKIPNIPSQEHIDEPISIMVKVVEEIYADLGIDRMKVNTFIADVLNEKGVQGAFILHRLAPSMQKDALLGVLDNPIDESEIRAFFDPVSISPEIKKHFGLKQ